ncbi:MAG TPA: carbamoyltransferase [Usitatibacter sp.]|nr:carbamoyltransferase [Usitatibacter sp.]
MRVLGISAFYHDSAAVLVEDGRIVAAAQEERFTRVRHDASFPRKALAYAVEAVGTRLSAIDWVVFYDKPFLHFERLLETYLAFAPKGFDSFRHAMPTWIKEKVFLKRVLLEELHGVDPGFDREKLLFGEHHLSHAASAFYPSPFEEAAVLTLDGVGEWATGSLAVGRGADLQIQREMHFPHSLGLLYSAFTYYTGFKVNSGEYKVMGLAPYGEPRFVRQIHEHLIDVKQDGTFRLNLEYFDYCTGMRMTNERFHALFGHKARDPADRLEQVHMDLAASVQQVTEDIMLRLATSALRETGMKDLCLAGGVALNCVANGRIVREAPVRSIWVQPAAGDAGGALGAALAVSHLALDVPRHRVGGGDRMQGSYLGPEFSQVEIETMLGAAGARFAAVDEDEMIRRTAQALASGKAVGWFQGRMEFGPRALGARSILGDARSPEMQKILNLKVKFRESFRPFAPAVLREDVSRWFELDADSPYMLLVAGVRPEHRREMTTDEKALFGIEKLNVPRSDIPAVTHVDYSARVQTVHEDTNPRFHKLLVEFKRLTGVGVLVNTSFNVRGEPIVCTPLDAFRCFLGTDLDLLVAGCCVADKAAQTVKGERYESAFALD